MIRKIVAVLAGLALVIGGPAASPSEAAGPDYMFTSNSDYASYYDFSSSPVQVYVTRYESRQAGAGPTYPAYVWLSYTVGSQSGYGSIPESSFSGEWATALSLHIDTSTLAAPAFQQNNGGGVIHLTWDRTHQWRSSWSGRNEYSYSWGSTTQTLRLIGASTSTSASVSGAIHGTTVSSPQGNVGRNHQVQFTYVVSE